MLLRSSSTRMHQALLLEPGQARVDGAGARAVGAAEAVRQGGDQLVAVLGAALQQREQVEAQLAVREDGRHHQRDPASPAPRSTVRCPETVLADTKHAPSPVRRSTLRCPGVDALVLLAVDDEAAGHRLRP